jgi:NAD(P)-dependent dehydrogenase (short-subunit alcohol dehydrogenase family)
LVASKPNQRLIATARDPSSLSYLSDAPNILKLALDVTSVSSVDAAFAAAAKHFKDFHLDVVVNNAGYSLSGDTEAATEEESHQEMETLFFGTARVTTRAIEVMRQAKDHRGGLIFNISSLAGFLGLPGHAYYHAAKFAVEGWSESVAREMHPDWNSKFPLFTSCVFKFVEETVVANLNSQLLHSRAQRCQDQLRRPQQSPHQAAPSLCGG